MVQVPEGTAVSTQGQHFAQCFKKRVMLTKDAPLTSPFFKFDTFFLTSQASKLYKLVALYGVVKDRFSNKSE